MRKLITFILVLAAVLSLTACMSKEAAELKKQYPQYFGLDASGGLDVVVWQMSQNSYSFCLLPHSEEQRNWLDKELTDLKPVSAEQMKIILSTYRIDNSKIDICIWQNPISSYIPEDLMGHGGDGPLLAMDYKNKIRRMLSLADNSLKSTSRSTSGTSIRIHGRRSSATRWRCITAGRNLRQNTAIFTKACSTEIKTI